MANLLKLYRCEVSDYFTTEKPDCSDCHTRSCQYNIGFSEKPCIMVKEVLKDDDGKILHETEEKPLYPNETDNE